jgi:hypothetical protein
VLTLAKDEAQLHHVTPIDSAATLAVIEARVRAITGATMDKEGERRLRRTKEWAGR